MAALCVVCAIVYLRPSRQAAEPVSLAAGVSTQEILSHLASPSEAGADLADKRAAQRIRMAALSWTRDPFSNAGEPGGSSLSLVGILWDPQKPLAIINGDTVAVGESVDGFLVTAIRPNGVTLSDGKQTTDVDLGR